MLLVYVIVSGLKYIKHVNYFLLEERKISNFIELNVNSCHVELCGQIPAIRGEIKFSFLWLHSELVDFL